MSLIESIAEDAALLPKLQSGVPQVEKALKSG